MLLRISHGKLNHNFRKKRRAGCRIKTQTVQSRPEFLPLREQILDSSVSVCLGPVQQCPRARCFFTVFNFNGDAGGRLSCSRVEHMSSEQAHALNSFLNRNCRIRRCCSAAFSNSLSISLCKRRSSMANISAAVLPVAHTINVNPNLAS